MKSKALRLTTMRIDINDLRKDINDIKKCLMDNDFLYVSKRIENVEYALNDIQNTYEKSNPFNGEITSQIEFLKEHYKFFTSENVKNKKSIFNNFWIGWIAAALSITIIDLLFRWFL